MRRAAIRFSKKTGVLFVLFVLLVVVSIFATRLDPSALGAVFQWWAQVTLLCLFVVVMRRNAVSWQRSATWFVIALLPAATLGIIQYATQHVVGSSFLGIAEQLPATAGVSVVEHGAYRLLRIYGSFPHPNIFGGWLVVGIVAAFLSVAYAERKYTVLLFIFSGALFSIALLLTYSRSAWIAACVAGILSLFCVVHSRRASREVWAGVTAIVFVVAIVGFSQRDHLLARTDVSTRLEAQSINVRSESLWHGWNVFRSNQWFGTGPNAELLHTADVGLPERRIPYEPPHNVYLLLLEDFGMLGALVWLAVIFVVWRPRPDRFRAFAYIFPLLIIGAFDHYLSSYWSGQILVAVVVLLSVSTDHES